MVIKLVMNKEQAQLLSRALEIIARCGMYQFADLMQFLDDHMDSGKAQDIEKYLKDQLSVDGNNGIASPKTVEECKVAWDAYQYLRRELAWESVGKDWRIDKRDWQGVMMSVSFDDPMKASTIPGNFKTERCGELI